jgi:predicted ABC-type ATPase
MSKDLYLFRGVSGSGKTTIAEKLSEAADENPALISEDDYFTDDEGNYNYRKEDHERAFFEALRSVVLFMEFEKTGQIFLHGVFNKEWQLSVLKSVCRQHGYMMHVMTVEKHHDNDDEHDVPAEAKYRQLQGIKDTMQLR